MLLPSWMIPLTGGLALAVLGAGIWIWYFSHPSHDRDWQEEHSVLPEFLVDGDRLTVRGVRNFHWRSASDFDPRWEERTYELGKLQRVWYILTPFSRSWRGPAHSLLSFQFGDDDFLAISVEARRAVGETYGIVKGMLRRFELIYVAGDERDLVGLRAIHRADQVFVYPIRISPDGARNLLLSMADSSNTLRSRPEFYHTVTNNCTTRIVEHVNRVAPGRVPRSWRILIPGYSDDLAHRLGLLDTKLPLDEARQRWWVNERARRWEHDPAFGRRIREADHNDPAEGP